MSIDFNRFGPALGASFGLFVAMLPPSPAHAKSLTVDFAAPPWHPENGVLLAASQSNLAPIAGSFIVMGADAIDEARREGRQADNHLEAEVLSPDSVDSTFSYIKIGYVSTSDWSTLDAKQLIHRLQEKWQSLARSASSPGEVRPSSVNQWLIVPTYDRQTQAVFLELPGTQNGGVKFWNGIGLKLGRYGVEIISVTGPDNSYVEPVARFRQAVDAVSFDPGARYEDFVEGTDKRAPFGIAPLVVAALGLPPSEGVIAIATAAAAHWPVLIKLAVLILILFRGFRAFIRRANKSASQLHAEMVAARNAEAQSSPPASDRPDRKDGITPGARPGDEQLIRDLEEDPDNTHGSQNKFRPPWWTDPLFQRNYYKINSSVLSQEDVAAFRLIYSCFGILLALTLPITTAAVLWFSPEGRVTNLRVVWSTIDSVASLGVALALSKPLAQWKNPSLIKGAAARAEARYVAQRK